MAWFLQRTGTSLGRLYLKEVLIHALPSVSKIICDGNTSQGCYRNHSEYNSSSVNKLTEEQHSLQDTELKEYISEKNGLVKQTVDEKFACLYEGITDIHTKPALPSRSFSLAPYVNQSETLRRLIELGVDLSKVEKKAGQASYILKMDFEKDAMPYIRFLHSIGVPSDELGQFITKNPGIFQEDLDHLQVRVNYLAAKKFSADDISRIVTKAPAMLSMTTKDLDKQLGYYQKEFRLTGDEVRYVITRYPKLTTANMASVQDMKFNLKEFMGYTDGELKQALLDCPRLYLRGSKEVKERFAYLYNEMKISADSIIKWPNILSTRTNIIRQRHLFLKHLGRDQFDPKKTNFVSLKTLVTGTDVDFCQNIAKTTVSEYNTFLKTL